MTGVPAMGPRDWARLIVLSLLWGGTFLFVGVAVAEVPPLTIVLARVGLAAMALNLVLVAMGQRLPGQWSVLGALAVMAVLNNVIPFCLLVWGQTRIASGLAAILNATTPLFTVLIAHWVTVDERLTPARLAGVLLGVAGVAILVGPSLAGAAGADLLAELACLGAALSYAVASLFGRRFRALSVTPLQTATGQVTASTAILLPHALALDRPWTLAMPSFETLASLVAPALASTALAYILFFRTLASAGATNLMLVTLLFPARAVILGAVVLGEALGATTFIGLGLIALGLAAIDGRPWARLRGLTGRPGRA